MKKNKAASEFRSLLGKFFTAYLPISVNASPNTIESYKCAFRLLFQYLNDEVGIGSNRITFETLNFDLLTNFFDWLATARKNSRTTMKQRLGALSSFAEYAQNRNLEAGYVFRNSLGRISKKSFRRVKGKQRCVFTLQELEIFFSLPDASDRIGWRDLVLLVVMYASGARAQEICDLTVKDVSHDSNRNAILTIVGKGEKPRRVKITNDATEMLNKYMAYRKIGDQPTRHVFSSQRNEQMSVSCVEEIFAKYERTAKDAHPDKFCSGSYIPHVMRHTTATHLLEAGVPLAVIKNILGHASIQTTQVYIEVTQQTVDKYMKEWSEKWFPKDEAKEGRLPEVQNSLPEFLR
ncbi:tyrosine-type recombinase/integrase [Paenibacillus sp. 32O-W]|uniref:tyrosine-type recombinase/integrase n=1 Tax=Paenibacillus sp. 32O-W TaxID=1695218 RepID=UPI00119D296D|nr:tyrosine-type recombinase/integrase [Paenibacillus sp. 32O-W]